MIGESVTDTVRYLSATQVPGSSNEPVTVLPNILVLEVAPCLRLAAIMARALSPRRASGPLVV